jgi:hypothetical protein
MGVVWRARDHRLGRDVALKLLAPSAIGNDIARARLVREARAAAGLQHEGIVHVYDVGETDDGGAFLVMELVGGRSLRALLEDGALSLAAKAEIVVGMADALGYAHEQGIIHRDVKPDNVLVRKNGRPVVLDFGLAKPVPVGLADTLAEGESKSTLTKDGHIVGTPAYLAPEQIRGGTVGPLADQFALAVTAYELFTGRLPWKGENVLEVLASMLADQPRRANVDNEKVSVAAADVLDRAMKKEPDDRWPSTADFGTALAEACGVVPQSRRGSSPSIPPSMLSAKTPSKPAPAITGTALQVPTPVAAAPASTRAWSARLARAGIVALLGAGAVLGVRASSTGPKSTAADATDASTAAPQPLGADAVVACPLFEVQREDLPKPTGWLGAAAAALACEHARVRLGGQSERTLLPAELVEGIPREPVDNAPADAYDQPTAAEQSRKSATRATATLDGVVKREGTDIVVEVRVRTRDGREIARGEGKGYELFVAVSNAMHGVRSAFGVASPSAFQKEWLRVDSLDAAEDYLDATVAILSEDNTEIPIACDRFVGRTDVKREMQYFVRAVCAERLKRAAIDEPPPAIDESSPGGLVTTIAAHRNRGGAAETKARLEKLVTLAAKTTSTDEKAIVHGAIAELAYISGDLTRAVSASRMAIQASPKLTDLRGTPWHRLSFSTEFDRSIAQPHACWMPWEPVAVQNGGSHGVAYVERVKMFGRAYELARRGFFATAYADGLARLGSVEQARGFAELFDSDHLRVRVLIAQTLYRKAIEYGLEVLRKLPADNASAGTAYRILASITEASRFLGKKPAFSEEILGKYLFADPPRLKIGVVPFTSLVYACADAPKATAKRCIARLREAYAKGDAGAIVGAAPALLEGAQYWIDGDAKSASNSWRPLLRESGAFLDEAFRLVMLDAFDAAGMSELGDRIDSDYVGLLDYPRSVDFSLLRIALRAEKRGDKVLARKIALHLEEALRFADAEVPMAKDVERLLERVK